ncbi:MAG: TonB-dependent receptor [Sedimentisphaerales bacterium]|nr:TonB-dependent receptor [Sedimentisphaerales bacterium]
MKTQDKQSSVKWPILLFFVFIALAASPVASAEEEDPNDLTGWGLEALMEIPIATLTDTKPRLVPAAITTITADQIKASGARSMFELLDIYVPNLEWLRHHWEPDALGLRGIISDRNDKFLLLVNGRNLNQRTHFGALSELDLVLLRDIHHIDIVRGPGSALYGPGAVSMVINIVTFTGETYQGTETTARLGAIEEFYSAEVKHGQNDDSRDESSFIYAGIGKYGGASVYDAPQIYPFNFSNNGFIWGGTEAGEPMTDAPIGRDGAAARGLPPVKLHAQITKENWNIWARYTRGGKVFAPATGQLAGSPYGWGNATWALSFYSYQQATGWIGYKRELVKNVDIDLAFSYDLLDTDKVRKGIVVDAFREDEYYGKALLRWKPDDEHSIALGAEVSHLELGLDPFGFPSRTHILNNSGNPPVDDDTVGQEFAPNITAATGPMPRWSSNLYSLLGEWQWTLSDKWTTFVGARIDDHTFTDTMFSPRAAIVFTPAEMDTLKLMWSRSVRANFEAEMKKQAMDQDSGITKPEKLDSVEFRYERQQSENLDLAASVFLHYNLEVIAWNQSLRRSVLTGKQKEWGLELEASYHNDKTRLAISHSYTKLLDFKLEEGQTTYITAEPYGYGCDLTNWSNHITKLTAEHKLTDKWTFDAALRIYWGFPGMREFDDYLPYASGDSSMPPIIEDGWKRAYRGSYYLNLGLRYKPSEDLTIGLTGYYLLGIFDKDLNKRNYVEVVGSGDFRSHAPAVGVFVEYNF